MHKVSFLCRGDRIRTCDHLVPNQERYRAALHPAAKHQEQLLKTQGLPSFAGAKVYIFPMTAKAFI